MTDTPLSDEYFDRARRKVLETALEEAPFDGWTRQMMQRAGERAALPAPVDGMLAQLFPRGVADLLDYWAAEEDAAMAAAYAALDPAPQKIREKITWLVRRRLEQLDPNREAARRAAATLALPIHVGLAPRLAWRTAGRMWMAIGDASLDGNFYTKRATLSAVYVATLARWMTDAPDPDALDVPYADTWAFLDARIGNVMEFEMAKARFSKAAPSLDKIIGALAKLRYGAH